MYNNKKSNIPVLKTIIILLISVFILISFMLILLKTNDVGIDDKKIQSQIILSKILNSNCFGDEYGVFEENKITQDNLNYCFDNVKEDVSFKMYVSNSGEVFEINPEIFDAKSSFCSVNSNIFCADLKYPIVVKKFSDEYNNEFLRIQIIIS